MQVHAQPVNLITAAHSSRPRPRVAVLYSGRFFGPELISSWADRPCNASVQPPLLNATDLSAMRISNWYAACPPPLKSCATYRSK